MTGLLKPEQLWSLAQETSNAALKLGALLPVETRLSLMEQAGIRFQLRWVPALQKKRAVTRLADAGEREQNPFLQPDPRLTVGRLDDHYLVLLNKFRVITNHLLLVSREFCHQERLLEPVDFSALWQALGAGPALGFYNGGEAAGASQPHRHLQLVPLPLTQGEPAIPLQPLLAGAVAGIIPGLPFQHAFARLTPGHAAEDPAGYCYRIYRLLLERIGVSIEARSDGSYQSAPYNLLMTRGWMLLVPRSREHADGISINALGFCGSLFLPREEQLQQVRRLGPMSLLEQVVPA